MKKIVTKKLLRNFLFYYHEKRVRLRAIALRNEERDKDKVEKKFSTIFPLQAWMKYVVGGTWIDYCVDLLSNSAYTIMLGFSVTM